MNMETQVLILAGGLGKRMGGKIPKVLTQLRERPLIQYTLDAVKKSGICKTPYIVIGSMADMVQDALGKEYGYIVQKEQFGTGHAVMISKEQMRGKSKNVLVLYGDQPFVTSEAIQKLVDIHGRDNAILSMMTVDAQDFKDWREVFYGFGRIIRDSEGNLASIRELKDCNDSEKNITEVNPSFFCFDSVWLWRNIDKLKNSNAQKEYYLTDLLALAIAQGKTIATMQIDPKIAIGINTPEQLAWAEKIV